MSNGLYMGGAWVSGGGAELASLNPATGETLWKSRAANDTDIARAVKAAHSAFPAWAELPLQTRLEYIERFKATVETHKEELATVISQETGKALWDAKTEVQGVIGKIAISLQAYRERTGEKKSEAGGIATSLAHRPHGVMAVFGPYNFPAHLPNGHMIPALIAGNCVILKPSDYTPLVGETLIRYWQEADIPPGVVQLVQGGRDTGIALAAAEGINGILFTGSVATGVALHKQFAGKLDVILALELGGNNPLIVEAVEDMDAAVYTTLQSAFITTGQRCTCARRLILQQGNWADAFLAKLAASANDLVAGAYTDQPEPFMGPLISEQESAKLMAAQEQLIKLGGRPVLALNTRKDLSAFISPGIIDVTQAASRPDEEWFGPLLQVIRVQDMHDAIAEANNTRYGLAAGIISDNQAHIDEFVKHVRAGVIAVNRQTTGASGALPFGGIGISGNHRPAAFYAADYCAYPVAMQQSSTVAVPPAVPPGMRRV